MRDLNKMDLTVIMVNYKCDLAKLHNCLKSININTDVLIIDHSNDLDRNELDIPKNINLKIIKNQNRGNGAGINCGIENSKTKYVLYLDIDTILPQNFFSKLENTVKIIQEFAVIAPKIGNFYNEKRINRYGNLSILKYFYNKFFYNLKKDNDLSENLKQVFFVSGSIMLINKEAISKKKIKFDENIFLFFEEDDFFHQCFKSKLKIYLINDLDAIHLDGSISDKSLNFECFKKWHWEWSKYYFLNKHYLKIFVFFLAMKNIFKFIVKMIIFYILNKKKFKITQSRLAGIIGFYLKKNCQIHF